jgi:hypothetical protein
MAAPFVSGIASVILAQNPNIKGYNVKEIIFQNSDPIVNLSTKVSTGSRVNAYASLEHAKLNQEYSPQPSYSYSNEDRQLASSVAGGGGCGMVTKLYSDYSQNRGGGPRGGGSSTSYIVVVLGLMLAPLLFLQYLKARLPANRRLHQRYEIDSNVKVKVGERELVGSVSSISLGGLQINTTEWLDKGSVITMTISSPDGKEVVEANGQIGWSESEKAYGVKFAESNNSLRQTISNWTKKLKPAA